MAVLAVVAVAVFFFVRLEAGNAAGAAGQPVRPAGVTWGDGHFRSQKTLATWLGNHGADYQIWLRRHPSGRYLLTHAAPRAQAKRAGVAGRAQAGSPALESDQRSNQGELIPAILYGAALLLLGLAALPHGMVERVRPEVVREQSLRVGSATVGLAIALGATVALLV
jgi:hypothetical protein